MNSKIKRIINFSTAFGPSGMEDEVSSLAMEDVKDICEVLFTATESGCPKQKDFSVFQLRQQFCCSFVRTTLICPESNIKFF